MHVRDDCVLRPRALLYRHAETRPGRAHAWQRLVCAHHRPGGVAAHPGAGLAAPQLSTLAAPAATAARPGAGPAVGGAGHLGARRSVVRRRAELGGGGRVRHRGGLPDRVAGAACWWRSRCSAGGWADRRGQMRVMIGADLARAAVLLAAVAAWLAAGDPPGWSLVACVLVLAGGMALFRPAMQAEPAASGARPRAAAGRQCAAGHHRAHGAPARAGPGRVLTASLLPLVHFVTLDAVTFLALRRRGGGDRPAAPRSAGAAAARERGCRRCCAASPRCGATGCCSSCCASPG